MQFTDKEAALLESTHAAPSFRGDVLRGLSVRPRAIPARWFYDHRGSKLFEGITQLPEYYPSRTERAILGACAQEVAQLAGRGRVLVEFGSGASVKTPLVISAVQPSAYVPVEISGEFLRESASALARIFPALPIHPVEADFTQEFQLPKLTAPKLGFFPGSTIGNLAPHAAVDLLRFWATALGPESQLLIGIDRLKDPAILVPAYDDAHGVTATFNLNLLHRINRELQADVPLQAFKHLARWNDGQSRVEMHLQALRDVEFTIDGQTFHMREGETIHTENSTKYGERDARVLLRAAGWEPIGEWVDAEGIFAVIQAKAVTPPWAP